MPIVVDLTGVVAGGPPPLEAGFYPGTIAKADIHDSKASQEPTLYLDVVVTGEIEGEEVERTLRWNTSMQQKQLGRFKQLMERLGIELPDGPLEFDEEDLVGVECKVRVTQREAYNDPERMTNNIPSSGIYGADYDEGEAGWG